MQSGLAVVLAIGSGRQDSLALNWSYRPKGTVEKLNTYLGTKPQR